LGTSKKLIFSIFQDVKADTIDVPTLPDVALKVRDAIRDPNSDYDKVANIIKIDATLSAYLLKVANSPLYRGVSGSQNISQALNRLGLSTARNLTLSFAMRAIFKTRNKDVEHVLQKLWTRNTYLASICSVLATKINGYDPERALLAGLLQDIGTLPIVNKLANYPDILNDSVKLTKIFDEFCIPIGILLMNHWKFEKEFLAVVQSRKQWLKQPGEAPCYADLVLIARYHSILGSKFRKKLPQLDSLPAFEAISKGKLTPKSSMHLLQEAKEDIKIIQALLR
jgi:HD-like signal output (HDOD) protein